MIETWLGRLPISRLKNTLTGRVLVNAGWASAATPITLGLGIIHTGMMARMLGPQGIGIIALLTAICGLFGGLLTTTSAQTAIVYVSKALTVQDKAQAGHIIRYCYRLDFLTAFVTFIFVALSALYLPRILNLPPDREWLLVLFGLTLVFQSTYWVSHALLRVAGIFSWTFFQSIGLSILKTALVTLLFVKGAGLTEVVLLLVGLSLLNGLSMYVMAHIALRRKQIHETKLSLPWWRVPREVWRFEALGFGGTTIKGIYNYLDVLLIGYLSIPASVGLFRAARQLTDLLNLPTQALVSSMVPEYSRLWFGGDIPRLRRLVWRFTLLLSVIVAVIGLGMALLNNQIIHLVFGDAFLAASEPLLILVLAALLGMAMTPLNSLQVATGRAGPSTVAGVATIVVQALVMLVLVPRLGLSGAAWARVIGILASLAIMVPTGIMRLRGQAQAPVRENSE